VKRLGELTRKEDVPPMEEMRVRRKSGETVDVEVYSRPGPGGGEGQLVFHDVTRTKTLLREMHHRVRRSYNQVNGFLTLQEQFTEGPEVSRAFGAIRERIHAMALVHSTLYRTERESEVEMELYLKDLRDALLREHGCSEEVDVDFSAHGIVLNEKRATACGLIVTELVSNSLLHAFPNDASHHRRGRVSVSLSLDGDVFRLVAADNGIGMRAPSSEAGESMGLSLVRSLVSDDLKGTMSVGMSIEPGAAEQGTCFTIEFPRTERRRAVLNGG